MLVVGGGINGCGIARDLAGRGWRVVLVQADDLAAHTSSASTKLIHGGLRYLEHGEFGLVRKALREREVLLRSAPHLIRPLRFVMPHDPRAPAARPAWLIRLGLFLYDHLARREWLRASRGIDLRRHPAGAALQPQFTRGFVYSDAWVDDARLVVVNAVDARERGARILPRTRCTAAVRGATHWLATVQPAAGPPSQWRARVLVNATGPWAERFLRTAVRAGAGELPTIRTLRLVKGSHIVVPSRFAHDHAYLFQNPDGRILFAIPYEQHYTLIGTTDIDWSGDPADVGIDADEVRYLCEQAGRWLALPVTPADVVWHYSGVRPLLDDAHGVSAAAATRDYLLEHDDRGGAPLLSVWGGKITTYRRLAEEAAEVLGPSLGGHRPAWTEDWPLPGGDLRDWIGPPRRPDLDFARFEQAVQRRHAWLPAPLATRWARAYGSRITRLLAGIESLADLGAQVAPGLFEAELHHLMDDEWARTGEDVLWRRSKLGLHHTPAERERVDAWCRTRAGRGC